MWEPPNWKQRIFIFVFAIPILPIYLFGLPFYILSEICEKIADWCMRVQESYAFWLRKKFPQLKEIYENL